MGDPKNTFNEFVLAKDSDYTNKEEFHALRQLQYIEIAQPGQPIKDGDHYLYYYSEFKTSDSNKGKVINVKPAYFVPPYAEHMYLVREVGGINSEQSIKSVVSDETLKIIEDVVNRYNFKAISMTSAVVSLPFLAVVELQSLDKRTKAHLGIYGNKVYVVLNLDEYKRYNKGDIPPITLTYSLKTMAELIAKYITEKYSSGGARKTRKSKKSRSRKIKKTRKH